MRRSLLAASILSLSVTCFAQRSIAILGSSTAEGRNADSGRSWVALTAQFLKDEHLIDTIYNLAHSGEVTNSALPLGYPGSAPDSNISSALNHNPKPKLIIVSFPSNDLVNDVPMATYLGNLRIIYNTARSAGVECFITTTQPRDDIDPAKRALQKAGRDSILLQYPFNSLNFWDTIVNTADLDIRPEYSSSDGIHLNNAGHFALFQIVQGSSGLLVPLPLFSLANFTASPGSGADARVSWTMTDEPVPVTFDVQRSADSTQFEDLQTEWVNDGPGSHDYAFTDHHMLAGKSFYRLKITENAIDRFSPIATILNTKKSLALVKIYYPSGANTLVATVSTDNDQPLHVLILNSAGAVIRRQLISATAPTATIILPIGNLAAGQYYLQVSNNKGQQETSAFTRF